MGADGSEYVSRDRLAVLEREARERNLRINKRQIAADVLRGELKAGRVPPGVDERVFRAVVARLAAALGAT